MKKCYITRCRGGWSTYVKHSQSSPSLVCFSHSYFSSLFIKPSISHSLPRSASGPRSMIYLMYFPRFSLVDVITATFAWRQIIITGCFLIHWEKRVAAVAALVQLFALSHSFTAHHYLSKSLKKPAAHSFTHTGYISIQRCMLHARTHQPVHWILL